MKKLALMLAVVLAFSFALSACGGAASSATTGDSTSVGAGTVSTDGKQLTVQVGPDPETLDPALNSAVDGGNMILHLFECLLTVDEEGELAPGAAESWEVTSVENEDGTTSDTWTFHLRDGLKWSDGSDLTAHDFVYTYKRVADPETAAPYADTVLQNVKGFEEAIAGDVDALGVSAPDDKTFVVELSDSCPYFGSLAAFVTLSPVNQATIEANGDAWAISPETYICNGAFYISEWVPGSHIVTTKNPNYWNADAIKLDSIKWLLIENANTSYSAFQTGEALFIKDVPTEEIPSLEGDPEFHVAPILGTYYLSINNSLEIFQDARVRKALSLAIDREYVANTLMQGTYSPAYNFIGPGWMDPAGGEFEANANGGESYISTDFEANLAEAKQLMADAGYPNGEGFPTITYSTNDSGYHKVVAEYLQEAWKELGITLKVDILEWASFTPTRRAGDYEIARNGWVGDYSDPSNMLDLFCTDNGNNDGKFSSEAYDTAMEMSRVTTGDERSEMLHEAEDVLMADAACIPLAYYNDFWLQSEKIEGMWHSAYGYWYFMYADIVE